MKPLEASGSSNYAADFYKFQNDWFTGTVDVIGRHLSGLLLIKKMENGSERVVFTSEAGVTFFDFEYLQDGTFKTHQIMDAMDKKAVVNTLRKDFSLILGHYFKTPNRSESGLLFGECYQAYDAKKEVVYIVLDSMCQHTKRLEMAGKEKKKVTAEFYPNYVYPVDSIVILHHTFDMKIKLTSFQKD